MGRRALAPDVRRERERLRQEALIDAARFLFVHQGYKGTTLESIIGRVGGSRETIYRVFGGKSGLFSAIISQASEKFSAATSTLNDRDVPPREGLTRFSDELVLLWNSAEGKAVNQVILSEGFAAPELVDAWYNNAIKPSIEALVQYLEAQIKAGRLETLEAELVARQFLMLLMGEIAFPVIARSKVPRDPARQIERCVDMILRSYEKKPAGPRRQKRPTIS